MQKIILISSFCLFSILAFGQKVPNSEKQLSVTLASGAATSAAVGLEKLHFVGKKQKLIIGYGLRYTGVFAKDKDFLTAPAKLTSGKQSLAAFFTEYNPANIDTVSMANTALHSLNLNIQLGYKLSKKLDIGFNIDALGFTAGGSTTGKVSSAISDSQGKSNNAKTFDFKPTTTNVLLISDSDIGTLNSELYAKYKLGDRTGLRAGLSFQFAEYKANQNIAFDNDRFRLKALLPMVGLTFKL